MSKNRNDITGDLIRTKNGKGNNDAFSDGYDRIWGKKMRRTQTNDLNEYPENDYDEDRIDVIGQNGSLGLHYNNEGE